MSAPRPPEKTWPPEVRPTPEQWLEWFDRCSPGHRLDMATELLRDRELADRCFEMNHEGELRHARAAINRLTGVTA